MSRVPITTIIFTLNEEIHLPSCLDSLHWCDDIVVVDSFSNDKTQSICEARSVRFFQNGFEGFGTQRNWAMDNTSPRYHWILILDADERVTEELAEELASLANNVSDTVGAYRLRRRFYMWGRWLRYSSLYPSWVVRLVHRDRVRYVNRGHGETQEVIGSIESLQHDLIDENLKGMHEWGERQKRYAIKEAEFEMQQSGAGLQLVDLIDSDPMVRRAALKRLSWYAPARGLCYFIYSYLFRLGFLDGPCGFRFCRMKAAYQNEIAKSKKRMRVPTKV